MSALETRVFWVEAVSQRRHEVYRYSAFARGGDLAVRRLHAEGLPDDQLLGVEPGGWAAVTDIANRGVGPIVDTVEWEPVPDQPKGYVRIKRRKTVREVSDELGEYLDYSDLEYGLSPFPSIADLHEWPEGRIACFAVRGSSEGDYIHVEVLNNEHAEILLLAKTFSGRDAAWLLARRIADLLGV